MFSTNADKEKQQLLKIEATTPPDGGWGWMIVLAVFMNGYFTWGVYVTYPIFYEPFMQKFGINLGDVTWISGTHEIGRAFGHLAVPLFGKEHRYRIPSVSVSLISAIAISLSGLVTSEYLVFLLLSFIPGFALGYLTVSNFVMLARYFDTKKYFAFGIAQTGAAVGTLSLAPLVQFLVDFYGINGAILLVGGLSLQCVVASALMRPIHLITDKSTESTEKTSLHAILNNAARLTKLSKIWIAVFILLFTFGGYRAYLAFLVPLANTFENADHMKSSLTLTVFCSCSLVTRILIGVVGDFMAENIVWLLFICSITSAVCIATVWFITSYTWLFINCAICSVTMSTCNIMVVPIVSAVVGNTDLHWGISLTGFIYTLLGAGLVPLTGFIIDVFKNVHLGYVVATSFMLIGSLFHVPLLLRSRKETTPTNLASMTN